MTTTVDHLCVAGPSGRCDLTVNVVPTTQDNDRSVAHHGAVSENEPVAQPARARWRERSWSLPVVVVVALVAVLLGGLGGAALASVGDHQDGRRGFGPGNGPGGGGFGPGQRLPGQQPFRFDDPYGDHRRGGTGGQVTPFGSPAPTPAPATPSS